MNCKNLSTFIFLILSFVSCITSAAAQQSPQSETVQPRPVNLDFEQGVIGQLPTGWKSPTRSVGYAAETVETLPRTGSKTAVLRSEPNAKVYARTFGNLTQAVDAAPFRGKRVRLRGAVRVEPGEGGGRAYLWMRVDRPNEKNGFFDNMNERPITAGEWRYYEIVGDVD